VTTRSWIRKLFARPATRTVRKAPGRLRPPLETLEDRLAPAVQLSYGGPGHVLSLQELVSGATPDVPLAEPTPGPLAIDLGAQTFAPRPRRRRTGRGAGHGGAGDAPTAPAAGRSGLGDQVGEG
jgi:hypothetical protein